MLAKKETETMSLADSALLLVGHGSTENPDSSLPYYEHMEELRSRNIFAEVQCCFWKEEPSMREAYYMIDSPNIYVVPEFISEGYFTQEVIPRELELNGPTSKLYGKTVHYCKPVGSHPSMTNIILNRAQEETAEIPLSDITLFIVGHGTGLNSNSRKIIEKQAEVISKKTDYKEVIASFMEEPPLISDWYKLSQTQHVVVVPFFMSDGLHSYQDIPVLLGIAKDEGSPASQNEVFRNNPYNIKNKKLYYTSAIGTERMVANVILEQVLSFNKKHKDSV